jgi:hypothetical protein
MQLAKLAVTMGVLLWILARGHRLQGRARALVWAVVLAALAVQCRSYWLLMSRMTASPPEWDFLCFWIWGRMGLTGVDFYDPASGVPFAAGRSAEFVSAILDVGFWYPPQSMLLFAPLGLSSPRAALWGWFAFLGACVGASSYLTWRFIAADTGRLGLVAVTAFLFALPGTKQTFICAQTHPLGLLLSLLVVGHQNRLRAGAFAALALIVKPYLVLWVGFLALRRRWRALQVSAITFGLIALVTSLWFGPSHFGTYLLENPMQRAPLTVFSEGVNQSLYATILRSTSTEHLARDPLLRGAGALGALLVLLPALKAAWRTRDRDPLFAGLLLLSSILVVYPFTLAHYSMMMAPMLIWLWSRRNVLRVGPRVAVLGILAAAVATGDESGRHTFYVHLALFAWLLAESRGAAAPAPSNPTGR